MTYVVHRPNLLDRSKDTVAFMGNCSSVTDALVKQFGTTDFSAPTYVEVNGVPWLRKQWNDRLPTGAVVTVNAVPGAISPAVLTAVAVVSLLATAYTIYKLSQLPSISEAVGASVPEKSPVFTFEGQKNIQRLNNVVDVVYGRMRWWPAYLCAPYVDYYGNKPTLHVWLSLGKGNYALEDVKVNDTSLSAVSRAVYEQHDSGYTITANDDYDLVYYAEDLSGTELTGVNEEEHILLGPYVLNPANTTVDVVKVNFSYPSGLYTINTSTGATQSATAVIDVTLHEIDDTGKQTGGSETFTITHTKTTNKPLRITETLTPSSETFTGTGRYSISVIRTNNKNTSTNGQDQCNVEAAFALGRSLRTYTSSILHVVLPGSSIVGQNAAEKINVVGTRKLRYRKDGAWNNETALRNPVWAIVDILQQDFGAATPDASLDLDYWETMADTLSLFNFDYRFEQKTTIWDAIQAVATVFRGKAYWVGSDIRISVDTPVQVPVCVYTPDSAKDLHLRMSFKTSIENDCVEAAYVDSDTGLQDTVFFTPPGSSATNPTKITFPGVTDRETAWKLAAYTYLQKTLLRDSVSFTTGLDGKIPMLGEVVLISWPLPSWASAGIVLAYDGENHLEVSEPVPFADGWIALRASNGSTWGPVQFIKETYVTEDGNDVVHLEFPPDASFDFTAIDRDHVAYTIGQADIITRKFQVVSASPSGDSVKIEASEFAPGVFSYDALTVPERGDDMLPYPAVAGPVPWVRVLEETGQYLRAEIGPVYGNPTSVVASYAYVKSADMTEDMLKQPWLHFGEFYDIPLTVATEYGNSYYIPRQDDYLVVRIAVTMAGGSPVYHTWWRSFVRDYGNPVAITTHVFLVNNCDEDYAAPGDPDNAAGAAAQGSFKDTVPGYAKFDTNEGKLVITTDAPPSSGAAIMVYTLAGSVIDKSIVKTLLDVGPVTFTAQELIDAGIQGTESTYPTIIVAAMNTADAAIEDRIGCFTVLDPQPLTTAVVEQTVSYEYSGKSLYLSGKAYGYVAFAYTTYARAFVHLYTVRLVNGFSGTRRYKYSISGQTANGFYDTNDIRQEYVEDPYLVVPRFVCAHMDSLVYVEQGGTGTGYFTAKLRLGNRLFSEYGLEKLWFAIPLDKNFNPVTSTHFIVGNGNGTQPMRLADSDVVDDYFINVVPDIDVPATTRGLTVAEWNMLQDEAVYFLFPVTGGADYSLPSISTNGWGRVKIAMIDMFGKKGNETSWTEVTTP